MDEQRIKTFFTEAAETFSFLEQQYGYQQTEMLGHNDDPNLLLKETSFRRRNKRLKLIEMRMHDIVAGLARATQIYAIAIVKGDTDIFPKVMEYYVEQQRKMYGDHPPYRKK